MILCKHNHDQSYYITFVCQLKLDRGITYNRLTVNGIHCKLLLMVNRFILYKLVLWTCYIKLHNTAGVHEALKLSVVILLVFSTSKISSVHISNTLQVYIT